MKVFVSGGPFFSRNKGCKSIRGLAAARRERSFDCRRRRKGALRAGSLCRGRTIDAMQSELDLLLLPQYGSLAVVARLLFVTALTVEHVTASLLSNNRLCDER